MKPKFSPASAPCGAAQASAPLGRPPARAESPAPLCALDDAGLEEPKLALAATFAAEPLRFWRRELALGMEIAFAPYHQVFQQLLAPSSLLASNRRGLNVLLIRWEDLAGAGTETAPVTPEWRAGVEHHALELLAVLRRAVAGSPAAWLVCLCPASRSALAQPAVAGLFSRLQARWAAELSATGSVRVAPPAELDRFYPVSAGDAPYANQLAHMPYTAAAYTALGTFIMRQAHALWQPVRKVIAVDCDQTLWCGVCGEVGAAGVQFDAPRLALQRFLRQQQEQGLLLCLCSKNHDADVAAVFEQRPEMILRREDFAAQRVNWQSKSANVRALAEELELALSSFILVDDNRLECAEVQAHCPGVLALALPDSPAEWPAFLEHVWAFDRWQITPEDRRRTAFYHQNRLRRQVESAAVNLGDFLAGLNLEVSLERARDEQLPRAAELTQRTTQFNCAPHRRTEAELSEVLRRPGGTLLTVSLRDRFGDYGLVGLILYTRTEEALEVDTFLLSCRALGKGVEHRMLASLGQIACDLEVDWVEIPFRPEVRNQPAWNFLSQVGGAFRQAAEGTGSRFRFPAGVAAKVRFEPGAAAAPASSEAAATRRKGETLVWGAVRYAWIATLARTPEQILHLLEREAPARDQPGRVVAPPQTPVQEQLCQMWRQVLRLERLGIRDDFFELGGTSQVAVRFLADWEQRTGQRLPLVALFKAPTIERLARFLELLKEQLPTPGSR